MYEKQKILSCSVVSYQRCNDFQTSYNPKLFSVISFMLSGLTTEMAISVLPRHDSSSSNSFVTQSEDIWWSSSYNSSLRESRTNLARLSTSVRVGVHTEGADAFSARPLVLATKWLKGRFVRNSSVMASDSSFARELLAREKSGRGLVGRSEVKVLRFVTV